MWLRNAVCTAVPLLSGWVDLELMQARALIQLTRSPNIMLFPQFLGALPEAPPPSTKKGHKHSVWKGRDRRVNTNVSDILWNRDVILIKEEWHIGRFAYVGGHVVVAIDIRGACGYVLAHLHPPAGCNIALGAQRRSCGVGRNGGPCNWFSRVSCFYQERGEGGSVIVPCCDNRRCDIFGSLVR